MVDKLERLLNLTAALLETPKPLTAVEIRGRVPGYPDNDASFRRAFERDKDDLREMGIPLSLEPISHTDPPTDGYRIHKRDYYLRDPGLEADELAALHLAASAVRLDGVGPGSALAKLGGTTDPAPAPDVALPELNRLPTSPELVQLFDATSRRRRVEFDYHGERRRVDPYRLDYQRGRWYVTGFDHARDDERVFRLDRIEGAIELGSPHAFRPPATEVPGIRRQAWELGGSEAITATLHIDADQAVWARHAISPEQIVEERSDGSLVVELAVGNPHAFRSFVLGFLEHAEILAPAELRDDLVSWLEAFA